jgi:uncharacterized membrane protein YeaQ/YmgE (transglycosylase-associated protein family)
MTNWLVWMASGVFAGWLTGLIVQGRGFGLIGDLVLGLLGGLAGGWLAGVFNLAVGQGWAPHLLISTIGGALLVGLLRLVRVAL